MRHTHRYDGGVRRGEGGGQQDGGGEGRQVPGAGLHGGVRWTLGVPDPVEPLVAGRRSKE